MKKPAHSTRNSLSIITPTYNNESDMDEFLGSLNKQSFPKNKLEILILDGGSEDKTIDSVKKFQKNLPIRIIHNPDRLAEPGVNLGMTKAHNDLLMVLAVDNMYKDPRALEIMTDVFNNPEIYGAFPKHDSDNTDNLFTKYHNTFTDPFNHFVYADAANARTFHRVYPTLKHNEVYDVYDYAASKTPPMIAFAQGFTIRKNYRRDTNNQFDDIRPIIELIEAHKKIAYVHSLSLYHHTTRNMDHFIRKQRWATQNAIEGKKYGIAHRVTKLSLLQKMKMVLWPLYAFSFILPLVVALIGVARDKKLIWLFHPIIALLSAYASFKQIFVYNIKKGRRISRQ